MFLAFDLSTSDNRGLNGLSLEDSKNIARVERIDVLFRLLPTPRSRRLANGKNAIDREETAKSKEKADRIREAVRFLHFHARVDAELMQEAVEIGSDCDHVYGERAKVETLQEGVRAFRAC